MLSTDDIDMISPVELNSEASLLIRMDREYLVPPGDTQHVISHLAPRAQVLQIGSLRHFRHTLTYLDTFGLNTYFLTTRKRRRCYKIRTHTYLNSGLYSLEVKANRSHEATVKDHFKYDPDDADRVTSDGRLLAIERPVELGTYSSGRARTIADVFVPVVDPIYSRTTLHPPHDEARAAFDTQLTQDLFSLNGKCLGQGIIVDHFNVVETKNPPMASPTDRLLWHQGHQPARTSEYVIGMALLYVNLPTNRWNRTIKRDPERHWHQTQSRQLTT